MMPSRRYREPLSTSRIREASGCSLVKKYFTASNHYNVARAPARANYNGHRGDHMRISSVREFREPRDRPFAVEGPDPGHTPGETSRGFAGFLLGVLMASASPAQTVVITGVTVINPRQRSVQAHRSVVIGAGRIRSIEAASSRLPRTPA